MKLGDTTQILGRYPFASICGGVLLILFAVLWLRFPQISESEAVLEKRTAEYYRFRANVTNSAQLKEQHEKLAELNAKILERLISPGEIAANQQFFYKLESETGVKLVDLRQTVAATDKAMAKAGFLVVPYTITFQGTIEQCLAFMRRLQTSGRFCRIMTASVHARSGVGEDPDRSNNLAITAGIEILGHL